MSENVIAKEAPHRVAYVAPARRPVGLLLRVLITKLRPLWVIGAIVVLWELFASSGFFPPVILPKFSEVMQTMYAASVSGELFLAIAWSCYRVLLGFFIGLALGFPLGLAIGWSRIIHELVNPVVEVLRPVPPLAWIPLAVIWFGVGFKSVMFITVMGSLFPITLAVISGVHSVDKHVIEYARTLGASTNQILRHVVIPAALPGAFVGMRIAIGFSWMVVVAAEMISVKYGLGWMIWKARFSLDTDTVIAGMITIGALSMIMTKGMLTIEKRLFRWREYLVKGKGS